MTRLTLVLAFCEKDHHHCYCHITTAQLNFVLIVKLAVNHKDTLRRRMRAGLRASVRICLAGFGQYGELCLRWRWSTGLLAANYNRMCAFVCLALPQPSFCFSIGPLWVPACVWFGLRVQVLCTRQGCLSQSVRGDPFCLRWSTGVRAFSLRSSTAVCS